LGLARLVLIHASVYGDNRRLLRGLELLGDAARGIAVLTGDEDGKALQALDACGVRGVRLNNTSNATLSPDAVADAAERIARKVADLGWHVQVLLKDDDLKAVLERLDRMPAPMVIDHFGLLAPGRPDHQATTDLLTNRIAEGRCWVKLSAPYWLGENGAETARDLTQRFIAANPERLVWGSDWPHTPPNRDPELAKREQPFRTVDTRGLLQNFLETVPDADTRRRILVVNPSSLYGFT
ncbi:MAG: amidohydrolase family protein, partial [Rhodospirillales bacterium]|nr:amidohydrolase family protein [Rhodospirillales bacterium]